jgi:hypothetical protein
MLARVALTKTTARTPAKVRLDALHFAGATTALAVAVVVVAAVLEVAEVGLQRTRLAAATASEEGSTTPVAAIQSRAHAKVVKSLAAAGVVLMVAEKAGTLITRSSNVSSAPVMRYFVSVAQCTATLLALAAYLMVLKD